MDNEFFMFSFSLITNTCEKLYLSREVLFGKVYVHYSIDDYRNKKFYKGNNSQNLF